MATSVIYQSDLAVPPGSYLAEVLEELDMSQAELSRRMGRPAQAITEIVKGQKAITPETALQLEQVLRVPAYIWTGLESEYRLVQARNDQLELLRAESKLVGAFPYMELAKLGLVSDTRKQVERVRELLRFFSVSSLRNVRTVRSLAPAFRQVGAKTPSYEAIAAWLQAGILRSKEIKTPAFDDEALRAALPTLRELTLRPPEEFQSRLVQVMTRSGVAFVLIPHFPRTYVHGATFWSEGGTKAVLMMTIRGSWADVFWFSLFHEIGHLLLHSKHETFVEGDLKDPGRMVMEAEANDFAGDLLIPPDEYALFLARSAEFTPMAIAEFADEIGVAPGIVTGRLQHDELLPYKWHHCRQHYKWTDV